MGMLPILLFTTGGRLLISLILGALIIFLLIGALKLLAGLVSSSVKRGSGRSGVNFDNSEFRSERHRTHGEEGPAVSMTREPDAHEILGVPQTATRDEVRDAFRQHLKLYHPDRVAQMTPAVQRLATELTRKVNNAYEKLMKAFPN